MKDCANHDINAEGKLLSHVPSWYIASILFFFVCFTLKWTKLFVPKQKRSGQNYSQVSMTYTMFIYLFQMNGRNLHAQFYYILDEAK